MKNQDPQIATQSHENKPIANKDLKDGILAILERFPFYKYAANINRISEDTLMRMRKEDQEFADQCEAARGRGIMRFGGKANPEFILKNADPQMFKDKKEVEMSGEPLIIIKEQHGSETKPVADPSVG